jgi:predicted DNA-binding ribbon-helix-helix protein
MKPQIAKRSIVINGHKTSVSLEDAFWNGLKEIAADRRTPVSKMIDAINERRVAGNLSSALRLFVYGAVCAQAAAALAQQVSGGATKAAA